MARALVIVPMLNTDTIHPDVSPPGADAGRERRPAEHNPQQALAGADPVAVPAGRRYVSPFELALCQFALVNSDEGFDWLAKAFQDRCFELISLRVDPRWDGLRRIPRFEQRIGQLGLP